MSHQAWINDITQNDRLMILKKHPRAIIHITNPTFKEIKTVIDTDVDSLKANTEMCSKSQRYFITRFHDMLYVIKDPLLDIIDIDIKAYLHTVIKVIHEIG